jgi:hypothetical protein
LRCPLSRAIHRHSKERDDGHITFVRGIINKSPPDDLLRIWKESLVGEGGLDLAVEVGKNAS